MSRGGVGREGGAGRRRNAGGAGGGRAERTVQTDPWSTVGPGGVERGGIGGCGGRRRPGRARSELLS